MTGHDERPGVLMMTGAYLPEMSGAGLQCRELVRQLRDEVRFAVLTTTTDRTLPALDRDERDGIPVFRVFVDPASVGSKAAAALRMIAVLLRERRRFDVLHLHGFSQKSMLAILLGLALGKRIAIKLTSVGHDDPLSMKARGSFAYWCYSRARLFFGVSPRFQVLYDGSGLPRERFRLIPNGVDLERFRPATAGERRALRAELGLPPEASVTLFVGFFSREKCPDVLFDAWARSAPASEGSVLVFVGAKHSTYYEIDREMAEDIRRRVSELGLADRVVFVEATRDIDKYQRAADVFVLPSVREGLPNALLEALACGTPCIATRLEGVTDVLIEEGTSGLLVPPRDVAALRAALERLAADPDRARAMGARGRERMAREYSAAAMGRRYLAAYQELLAS